MSGHNKWSKVKNKKALTDAKKSKLFGKLARAITLESKKCEGDKNNPTLRTILEKARSENMPSDNIERAIQRGTGEGAGEMEQITYEAYGPGGVALVIEALTDNRNKAAAEIKHILSKHAASLASQGAALWNFEKSESGWSAKSTVTISSQDIEKLSHIIEELEDCDEVQEVFTNQDEAT